MASSASSRRSRGKPTGCCRTPLRWSTTRRGAPVPPASLARCAGSAGACAELANRRQQFAVLPARSLEREDALGPLSARATQARRETGRAQHLHERGRRRDRVAGLVEAPAALV